MSLLVVAGALANKTFNGGEAWVRLSWIRGFQQLGWDVQFLEQFAPEHCVDNRGNLVPLEESLAGKFFADVVRSFGFSERATLVVGGGDQTMGLSHDELLDLAQSTRVLVNISGHLQWPAFTERVGRRIYVDIDPGFTQFWHANGAVGANLEGHDDFFTIGENIGEPFCPIPSSGIHWRPVRQPCVLSDWPMCEPTQDGKFTTVASWRGAYGPVHWNGCTFGLKVHEFRKVMDLPRLSSQQFELALSIDHADELDRQALIQHGWQLVDPHSVASLPEAFRQYVQTSKAEFSAAQGIYVDTDSGWVSDRTIRYLASGKPVLVQETGFYRHLPVGHGLLSFRNMEDALGGVRSIERDYLAHSQAAREIAERYFDSDVVLSRFLDEVKMKNVAA